MRDSAQMEPILLYVIGSLDVGGAERHLTASAAPKARAFIRAATLTEKGQLLQAWKRRHPSPDRPNRHSRRCCRIRGAWSEHCWEPSVLSATCCGDDRRRSIVSCPKLTWSAACALGS